MFLSSIFNTRKPRDYELAEVLKNSDYQRAKSKSAKERRSLISIGVIDDEPFEPKQNLENIGYHISYLGDPGTIETVQPYHIILCDLQGVGRAFDSRRQGAFLIREIKESFPEKFVVAYTGGARSLSIARDSTHMADSFLKKDEDIGTWVERLDEIIVSLLDPYRVWQRQRSALIDREIDTLTIIKLEDAYVRSIKSRSAPETSDLDKMLRSTDISSDVREIVRSLIASGLFKLLVG